MTTDSAVGRVHHTGNEAEAEIMPDEPVEVENNPTIIRGHRPTI
jgi:hypothetical protein